MTIRWNVVFRLGLTSWTCVPLKTRNGTAVIASAEMAIPCQLAEATTCVGTGLIPLMTGATVLPAVVPEPMFIPTMAPLPLLFDLVLVVVFLSAAAQPDTRAAQHARSRTARTAVRALPPVGGLLIDSPPFQCRVRRVIRDL